jgi:hypothetical protein
MLAAGKSPRHNCRLELGRLEDTSLGRLHADGGFRLRKWPGSIELVLMTVVVDE